MPEKIQPGEALKLHPDIGSITRLKPKMVVLLLVVLAVAVAVAFSVGLRVSKRHAVDAENKADLRRGRPLESLTLLPKTYADVKAPVESPEPTIVPPDPMPMVMPELTDHSLLDEEEDKARTSGIFFGRPRQNSPQHAWTLPQPHRQFKGLTGAGDNLDQELTLGSNRLQVLRSRSGAEPYLNNPYEMPRSRYELKAGSVIPAALLTAINTDLPGDIVARVTEQVYDSATGRYLLIPQGATLYGTYDSLVANGQNRALVIWQRLIMPDGRSILLDGMAGVDKAGNSGLRDRVDYHLGKLAVSALLSTAITLGGNIARGDSPGLNHGDVIGDSIAQEASRVGRRIIDRQLDVQPTITIRAGWPLRVLVNKDLVFR